MKDVLKAIRDLIKKAHRAKVTVSICGQAPSFYPDAVLKTKKIVYDVERRLYSQ
ncbi:MAG: hypothetical protein QXD89_01960 [Candidatus Aenigmatarchaeota archaeon]